MNHPHAHPHSPESKAAVLGQMEARFHRDRGDWSRANCTGEHHERGRHPHPDKPGERTALARHTAMLNSQAHRQLPLFGISPAEWNTRMVPQLSGGNP